MVISEKILERFTHVGEAFLAFDVDRSGAITEQEIKLGLHNFGFDLSDTILSNICSRFAHDEAGLINYKSFCDYFAATLEGKGSLPMKAHRCFGIFFYFIAFLTIKICIKNKPAFIYVFQ